MKPTKLISVIEKTCKEISEKCFNINLGGCGVFASLMGTFLSKYGDVNIVLFGEINYNDIDYCRHFVKNPLSRTSWGRDGCLYISHVIIRFRINGKVFFLDSTGISTLKKFSSIWSEMANGYFTLAEITSMAKSTRHWNDDFDRKQIPLMRSIMRKHFSNLGGQK